MAVALALAAVVRRPHSVPKVAFGIGMLVFGAETFFGYVSGTHSIPDAIYWLNWRHVATSLLPGVWVLFSVTYGRGNYREFIARWWFFILIATAVPLTLSAVYFGELVFSVQSWQGGQGGVFLSWPGNLIQLAGLIAAIVVLMNLERTFRSAVGVMRWRLKYTVLGLATIFGERIYSCSQTFLLSTTHPSQIPLDGLAVLIGGTLIVVAVFRAGFFKVDVYPSHAFLSNSITAAFIGAYLLLVGVLAKVVGYYGSRVGTWLPGATVIVLLAALAILLFSNRAKQAFRVFVSRHLRRPSYDYRQIWTRFTERTAVIVEPEEYARTVVKWIAETCDALSVTLWFVDEQRGKLTFGASTSLAEGAATGLLMPIENMAEVIEEMRQRPVPTDIDRPGEKWVEALKRCNPEHFTAGGHRVCVPLAARAQLVGVLMVGDRVAGRAFSPEDLDLLKCLADQVASSLLNSRLGRRLMDSKQMEAFQTMSAFFVHDLKNTASTLSLMLQNLPVHFDNPEFRKDALRAVGKTVEHINDLIQRLGVLRRELELKFEETDLNGIVAQSLPAVEGAPGIRLVKSFGELPRIQADADQMGKVILNLLLNARDALDGRGGEIGVQTYRDADWLGVLVRDDGCGMTQDFVEKQLFKPFQTTKKKGIGIGMFQTRMIVEAHNGRIEVETEAGKGTAFRVLLPLGRRGN
jgi:putative PEP-CTERM system histidine kinase